LPEASGVEWTPHWYFDATGVQSLLVSDTQVYPASQWQTPLLSEVEWMPHAWPPGGVFDDGGVLDDDATQLVPFQVPPEAAHSATGEPACAPPQKPATQGWPLAQLPAGLPGVAPTHASPGCTVPGLQHPPPGKVPLAPRFHALQPPDCANCEPHVNAYSPGLQTALHSCPVRPP
jgi:hypothetical protein